MAKKKRRPAARSAKKPKRRPGVKVGRPLKDLPEKDIATWARMGASMRLIAQLAGCNEKTIRSRFSAVASQNDAAGKVELLTAQHYKALDGDVKMLQWLGANRLGQSSRPELGDEDLADTAVFTVSLRRRAPAPV